MQSTFPKAALEKLIEYKETHQLESVSQAVMIVLAAYFRLELRQPNSLSNGIGLLQRVEQIEQVTLRLAEQLAILEGQHPFAAPNVDHGGTGPKPGNQTSNSLETQKLSHRAANDQLAPASNGCQNHLSNASLSSEARSRTHSSNDHSYPASTILSPEPLSPEDWTKGVTTNRLVARLQSNPSTLKKYLRDFNHQQWARQQDPDGLGWTYDPLLERYYPVAMNADGCPSAMGSMTAAADTSNSFELQSTSTMSFEPELDVGDCGQLACKGGLTQSQFSRLAAIPINTLQRWKQLPDCTERIRCRTEGTFIYWYSEQKRRFYPVTSS